MISLTVCITASKQLPNFCVKSANIKQTIGICHGKKIKIFRDLARLFAKDGVNHTAETVSYIAYYSSNNKACQLKEGLGLFMNDVIIRINSLCSVVINWLTSLPPKTLTVIIWKLQPPLQKGMTLSQNI